MGYEIFGQNITGIRDIKTPPPLMGPQHRSRLTTLSLIWFLWEAKEPTPLFKKSRDVDPGGVANLFWAGWVRVRRDLNIGVTQITAYK